MLNAKRVLLMLLLTLPLYSMVDVQAWDEGVACNDDFDSDFWSDAQGFANIIDQYTGWNKCFLTHNPYPYMWKEESSGGQDNHYADGTHNNNVARILAENSNVADGDYINVFDTHTPVDNVKLVITYSL